MVGFLADRIVITRPTSTNLPTGASRCGRCDSSVGPIESIAVRTGIGKRNAVKCHYK